MSIILTNLVDRGRYCDRCGEYLCGYGHFLGGDPRRFIPDEDCSTECERDLHRRHCFAAAFFGIVDHACLCGWRQIMHKGVMVTAHVVGSPYGLGTYSIDCTCWYMSADRSEEEWKASIW